MKPIRIAILWHQHQPYYRLGNEFRMPWAWLHATKDYLEMAEHFERNPKMKGTINLVPSLIKQLQEYISEDAHDPVVKLMAKPAAKLSKKERSFLLKNFFHAHRERMIDRSPRYAELFEKSRQPNPEINFTRQDYIDLAVQYFLAWTGEIARQREPFQSLILKDRNFTEKDKQTLEQAQIENVKAIIPLHKKLAEQKQLELTTTPFYHPILPLLCDTNVAREAMPDVALPKNRFRAPKEGNIQIGRAREFFKSEVGIDPNGMWPSEGSLSMEALSLICKNGFQWTATDEAVLANSLAGKSVKTGEVEIRPEHARFFPWRIDTSEGEMTVFFRDHGLSDDIGFRYSSWDAIQAVDHFSQNILNIRSRLIEAYGESVLDEACISVILDGENCWEYYARNGFEFLSELYERLTSIPEIIPVTFGEALASSDHTKLPVLDNLVAGSWINGNFQIWIGHPEDNASWDALYEAKQTLDSSKASKDQIQAAHEELMIAEGSDWNWWYGDENFSSQKDTFDELYRSHLRAVYEKLDMTPPKSLKEPIAERYSNGNNNSTPKFGTMHPAKT